MNESHRKAKNKRSKIIGKDADIFILTTDFICREYCASRSRKAVYFLMRLCASCYTERQLNLPLSISINSAISSGDSLNPPSIHTNNNCMMPPHRNIFCFSTKKGRASVSFLIIRYTILDKFSFADINRRNNSLLS